MRTAQEFLQGVIDSPKISRESRQRLEEVEFHSAYAEPGYSDPESGVICTGNWNNADKKAPPPEHWVKVDNYVERVAEVLTKRYGAELEWSDEWRTCDHCSKLVRGVPDSYGWQRSYFEIDGETICRECAKDQAETILESIEGSTRKALTQTLGIDPSGHGYVRILEDLENGLREGQAADPKVIAGELKKLGVERLLFTIDSCGQFDVRFSCWVHEDEFLTGYGAGARQFSDIKTDADVSPAELCKRALREASLQSASLNEEQKQEGIVYTSVDAGGGTAKTQILNRINIQRCPNHIWLPEHYNEDGTCKCEKPN